MRQKPLAEPDLRAGAQRVHPGTLDHEQSPGALDVSLQEGRRGEATDGTDEFGSGDERFRRSGVSGERRHLSRQFAALCGGAATRIGPRDAHLDRDHFSRRKGVSRLSRGARAAVAGGVQESWNDFDDDV